MFGSNPEKKKAKVEAKIAKLEKQLADAKLELVGLNAPKGAPESTPAPGVSVPPQPPQTPP